MLKKTLTLLTLLIILVNCSNHVIKSDKLSNGNKTSENSCYNKDLEIISKFANNQKKLLVEIKYNPNTVKGKNISKNLTLWFNFEDKNEKKIGLKLFGNTHQFKKMSFKHEKKSSKNNSFIPSKKPTLLIKSEESVTIVTNKDITNRINLKSLTTDGIKKIILKIPYKKFAALQNINIKDFTKINLCISYNNMPSDKNMQGKRSGNKLAGGKRPSSRMGKPGGGRGGMKRKGNDRRKQDRLKAELIEEWYTVKLF